MTTQWTYKEAFKRNQGLIDPSEQQILRNKRVAIAGMGGVGGVHLITLARMGIGKFTIADGDIFETANFNRQFGATVSHLGKPKTEVMMKIAKDINPELDIKVINEFITDKNVDEFLRDADLFVDGIDAFAVEARRIVFREAARQGIFSITAGPIGFSTPWILFDPNGMRFDDYFDLHDNMDEVQKISAFIIGLVPKALHHGYQDLSYFRLAARTGPSVSAACQLASGVMGIEAVKILLKRGRIRSAPWYQQFDVYRGRWTKRKLLFANRGLLQRIKRLWLEHYLRKTAK